MKVYLDTCIVIYLVEAAPEVVQRISAAIQELSEATLCVSPLVRLECLVMPTRMQANELLGTYEQLFATFEQLPMPAGVYDRALHLRAAHNLKTPDALHLATALEHGCTEFWTNDLRLSRVGASGLTLKVLP